MKKLLAISVIVLFLFGFGGVADLLAGSRSGGGSFSSGGSRSGSSFSGSRSGGGGFSHSGSRSGSSGFSNSGSRSGGSTSGFSTGSSSSVKSGTRSGSLPTMTSGKTTSGHRGSSTWNYSKIPGGLPTGQKYIYKETIPVYVPSYRYYSGPGFMEWYVWWFLILGPHNYTDHPRGTRDPKSDELEMYRVQQQVVEKQKKAEEVPVKEEPGSCSQTAD